MSAVPGRNLPVPGRNLPVPAAVAEAAPPPADFGIVIIGRNEGERLRRCLASVMGPGRRVVYVDSGSTDGSVALARAQGAVVVELDGRVPFAPGRARNAGFRRLRELCPGLRYVQFVDGDCEVVAGWLECAVAFLDAHPDVAAVGGRLCERFPERSLYNLLCAIEWDAHAIGETAGCAGNALMRTDAFAAMDGYRDELIGGEEPELCSRLRGAGWRIWTLGDPVALHDAAMTSFGQWWKRAMRGGYALMQRTVLCGLPHGFRGFCRVLGVWFWALILPLAIVTLCVGGSVSAALLLLLLYPLQIARLWTRVGQQGAGAFRRNGCYAVFQVLAVFPRLAGQIRFLLDRWVRGQARLIEYKS